jgi:branched-chain amino acid transport system permease protein
MTILSTLIQGLSLGSLYALIALGFVIVFKATHTVNFALPTLLLVGGYVVSRTFAAIGFFPALLLGVAATVTLGLIVERLLLSRIPAHNHQAASILTIGVNVVLLAMMIQQLGERVVSVGVPWDDVILRWGDLTVPVSSLVSIGSAAVMILVLTLLLRRTDWGLAMRASIDDQEAAVLQGIRLRRISMSAWLVSGILATVAGIGLASFPAPGLSVSSELAAIKAFPAAIIGGMDSLVGAVVGGLIIGMTDAMVSRNQDSLEFLGHGLSDVAAFAVMIAVLMVKPSGLFGSKELARV